MRHFLNFILCVVFLANTYAGEVPDCVGWWSFDEGKGVSVVDSSSSKNAGTRKNGPVDFYGPDWIKGKVGNALYFNGEDQHVELGVDLNTWLGDTATMCFWIKTNQKGSDPFYQSPCIAGIEQIGGSNDIFWGWIDTHGRIGISAGNLPGAQSKERINDNAWHHIVFTRDSKGGLTQVFVDGEANDSRISEEGLKSKPFRSFGRLEDSAAVHKYFQGALDELRIYRRVLTSDEVKMIYTTENK